MSEVIEVNGVSRPLPYGWRCHQPGADGPGMFVHEGRKLSAILSEERHGGRRWMHLSAAHRDRIPTWEELVRVKEDFLGTHTKAIQVLPPRSEWVNINDRVLHLFCCLDGDVLPDFTRGKREPVMRHLPDDPALTLNAGDCDSQLDELWERMEARARKVPRTPEEALLALQAWVADSWMEEEL